MFENIEWLHKQTDLHLSHYLIQNRSIQQVWKVQMNASIIWNERLDLIRKMQDVGNITISARTNLKVSVLLTQVTRGLSMKWSREGKKTPLSIFTKVVRVVFLVPEETVSIMIAKQKWSHVRAVHLAGSPTHFIQSYSGLPTMDRSFQSRKDQN